MKISIGGTTLELVQGDITQQDVEAIVNAANSALAGGGGVDGAIHRAGGPQIMAECRAIGGCSPGEAVITGGGNLQARFVIHAVGPIYLLDTARAPQLLANAYRNSLKVAVENNIRSIAFPSLSTGAYRYPVRDAAGVAQQTVVAFLEDEMHELQQVRFVLFDAKTFDTYGTILRGFGSVTSGE